MIMDFINGILDPLSHIMLFLINFSLINLLPLFAFTPCMYHTHLHELVHLTFFVLTLNHLVKNIYTGKIASLYNVTFLNPQTSVCSPIPSLKNDHCCYHCIIILISFSSYSSSTFLLFPLHPFLTFPLVYMYLTLYSFLV